MTEPTDEEVRAIAEGLTKAQRDWMTDGKHALPAKIVDSLKIKGIYAGVAGICVITPLGARVAAALNAEAAR